MKRTFIITDRLNLYEVTVQGIVILQIIKIYNDSGLKREVHFANLPEDVQEQVLLKIRGDDEEA